MAELMDNKIVKKGGKHRNYTQRPSGHSTLTEHKSDKQTKNPLF